jgi:hypothetical protein
MKLFLLFILLIGFSSCATTESLDQYYAQINRADGINRNEAALIAKKWLIDSKYEGDFQIIGPVVTGHDELWQVTFLYKSLDYYEKVLDVYVDTLSGEVKSSEIRSKDTPPVTKEPWDTFNKNISVPNNL